MTYTPKTWSLNTLIQYTDMNHLETQYDEATAYTDASYNSHVVPYLVPVGTIVMWYGTSATVPSGWHICDGTTGTPDLRDKFVVGAGTTYAKGATGGAATHTLTTNEMPAHTHSITIAGGDGFLNWGAKRGEYESTSGTNSTGGGAAHNNLPPYHALYYIMKT
ncbi:MAG: hypothetical protein PHD63_07215 [Candidatus Marinimicrobia bacterium]|nr:hypothetical protein [Candidatus Neomarinimicrobiota bacterium]